eukprot:3068314-Heterocapsa_arctica.AAC.1
MTKKTLCEHAKTRGLVGYSRLKKTDLVALLRLKKTVNTAVGGDTSYFDMTTADDNFVAINYAQD